jgi:hypothetical protein
MKFGELAESMIWMVLQGIVHPCMLCVLKRVDAADPQVWDSSFPGVDWWRYENVPTTVPFREKSPTSQIGNLDARRFSHSCVPGVNGVTWLRGIPCYTWTFLWLQRLDKERNTSYIVVPFLFHDQNTFWPLGLCPREKMTGLSDT